MLRLDTVHHGDNLAVLRRLADGAVDLVYFDPPFNSGADYGAFDDRWRWGARAAAAAALAARADAGVGRALDALAIVAGRGARLAYLATLAPRLVELRRVMRPSASLYLHCDPTASPYLRVLLDAVFGAARFRAEIVWSYRRWPTRTRNWQRMHDVLLYYAKGPSPTFHRLYEPASDGFLRRFKGHGNRLDKGATTKRATRGPTPGMPLRDVWELPILAGSAAERLGYPTQKPEALVERLVRASSDPGDIVLDPACGSGTALAVARRLGRRFVGIDVSARAVATSRRRLSAGP